RLDLMAERVGFEPTVGGCPTHAFQACSFGHSDTSPGHLPEPSCQRPSSGACRKRRKKPRSKSAHSTSRIPLRTSIWWLSRESWTRFPSELQNPALGSLVPNTSVSIRLLTRAPAHMAQGSSVTYIVQPVRRQ